MRAHFPILILVSLAAIPSSQAQYAPRNALPPVPPMQSGNSGGNRTQQQQTATASAPTTATASQTPATNNIVVRNTAMPLSMDKIDDTRQLLVGDVVNYRVVEDKDAPRSLPITDSGEVEVPLIGRVQAAGKTLHKLAVEIKTLLEKDYYYQATVLLSMDVITRPHSNKGKVYVVGQIRTQGGQDIPDDEVFTVSKAILRAGGFGDFADKKKVKLVRKKGPGSNDTETTIVDLTEVFEKGNTQNDPVVKADDLIIVPQRLINF